MILRNTETDTKKLTYIRKNKNRRNCYRKMMSSSGDSRGGEIDVMRKYKLCHAHLERGEAMVKIVANLVVASLWLVLTPFHNKFDKN